MGLFASDRLFKIQDRQELLKALAARAHWNLIRPEVLSAIIDNAKGDVLKISRFVFVSEYHDCVKNNFVDLARIWQDPRLALSAFATTLEGLAGDIIQHLAGMKEGTEQQSQAISLVEIAFLSAILCDPYMLDAYKGLAAFYMAMGRKGPAADACRQYDAAEQRLLQAADEYSRAYRESRYKSRAEALRAEMDNLKKELGIPSRPPAKGSPGS